jgi:hypothetical protein
MGTSGEKFHRKNLYTLRQRDGDLCSICNLRMLFYSQKIQQLKGLKANIDHIIELRNGGSNKLDNLRLTHNWCNSGRANFTPRQLRRRVYVHWRKYLGLKTLDVNENITHFKKKLAFDARFLMNNHVVNNHYVTRKTWKNFSINKKRREYLELLKAREFPKKLYHLILSGIDYDDQKDEVIIKFPIQ